MVFGFALMVLLVSAAAWVGYKGSRTIQDVAQQLVREHLVDPQRGAALESRIEKHSEELLDRLTWILGVCLVLSVAGSAATIWVTDRAFRRLEWQSEELNQVSWHLVDSHEQTSRRFSHEMHDELGQSLTGLKGMLKRVSADEIDGARTEMLNVLEDVLRGVRELSQLLRPVILDDFGLDAGLRWLIERFTQRTQIRVDYQSNFNGRLSEPLETHLFRITQEALTNVARHSGATEAWVKLEVSGRGIRLTVEDNGHGLVPASLEGRPSLGMVGMRARARQVKGELKVVNREAGGLRIQVQAPLAKLNDAAQKKDADPVGG
jgi:signal transduction histidine kinase